MLTVFTLSASALFTNCNGAAENVEQSEKNVVQAKKDLAIANKEYLADMKQYKKETADKIDSNQKIIDDLNSWVANEKKEFNEEYKKTIAELEQQNKAMKAKLNEYKDEGKEKWETFKAEFTHDMDKLGIAFKNLTVKNVK